MARKITHIVGIDEAGRGPLAGPLSISAVCMKVDFDKRFFKGIRDSKRLSPKIRQNWLAKLIKEKEIISTATFISAKVIDQRGMSWALKEGVKRCLCRLGLDPDKTEVLLDGSLHAPKEYKYQKTIIGGDDIEPLISMASIVAKERRDRSMKRWAKKYPQYGFNQNMGYGTESHRRLIEKYRLSKIHRKSFCRNVLHKKDK